MKAIKTLFFVVTLTLVNLTSVSAEVPGPPVPQTAKSASTQADGDPLPGVPIDQNIVLLTIAGLALGITVLYKDKIKKASI